MIRSVNFILRKKVKYYIRETLKYFNIMVFAFGLIITILLLKYKPMYQVSISGKEIGYTESKTALEESVKTAILNEEEKNVDSIAIKASPKYELKLIDKATDIQEEKMVESIKQEVDITYKYYDILLNNQILYSVNTIEEAQQLMENIKEDTDHQELDLSIAEQYTEKEEEVKTSNIEIAKEDLSDKIKQVLKEQKKEQKEQERINSMPQINGIRLAYVPVSGTISSRYGASSNMRKSSHTGLDIAAPYGTAIKVVAAGTVTSASYQGSYGNLVKVNHGNGLETWYAHTSKMNVVEGQKVGAGDIIAFVGSTGNSTGNHLHLEIRINGQHVNPQNYLY